MIQMGKINNYTFMYKLLLQDTCRLDNISHSSMPEQNYEWKNMRFGKKSIGIIDDTKLAFQIKFLPKFTVISVIMLNI